MISRENLMAPLSYNNTVKTYCIERTSSLRASENFLLLTAVPKRRPATASTIARLIKASLTGQNVTLSFKGEA